MFLYITYPSWIQPQIFPGVKFLGLLRWYGLMYAVAFAIAYFLLKKVAKEGALDSKNYKVKEDDIYSFIFTGIVFLLLGARIFSTLIYDTSINYYKKPWLIFWPFYNGKFTGFEGMSYHGGFVGGIIGMIVWCKRHKVSFLKWSDAMVCAIPLGYTFGRIGNFLNGELYGRITTMPWGVVFPHADTPIRAFRDKWGITDSIIVNGVIPSIEKIAKKNRLTVIDLHSAITDEKDMTSDMIHPNDRGAGRMAQVIADALKPHSHQ